jgi:hypothetical protein
LTAAFWTHFPLTIIRQLSTYTDLLLRVPMSLLPMMLQSRQQRPLRWLLRIRPTLLHLDPQPPPRAPQRPPGRSERRLHRQIPQYRLQGQLFLLPPFLPRSSCPVSFFSIQPFELYCFAVSLADLPSSFLLLNCQPSRLPHPTQSNPLCRPSRCALQLQGPTGSILPYHCQTRLYMRDRAGDLRLQCCTPPCSPSPAYFLTPLSTKRISS